MNMPHITFSREINIFTAALLVINLLVFVFGGGEMFDKINNAMTLAQGNNSAITEINSSIADMRLISQRHEDNIEQLFQAVYGTPPSGVKQKTQAHGSADLFLLPNQVLAVTSVISKARTYAINK